MKEISKYEVYTEKLSNICEENGLTYSIQRNAYPFLLTIRPVGGMDAQLSMLEGMDENEATGYISPEASLVFAYKDGVLTHKISGTFTISDSLFNKLKNLFKNLHSMWTMHFFRNSMETGAFKLQNETQAETAEESDEDDFPEEGVDPFEEFMDDDGDASGLLDDE